MISDLEEDENEYGEGLGVWRGGGTRLARCPINEGTRINHPTQPTTVIQRHYPLHYLYSFLIISLLGMHHNNKRIAYIFGDGLLEGIFFSWPYPRRVFQCIGLENTFRYGVPYEMVLRSIYILVILALVASSCSSH